MKNFKFNDKDGISKKYTFLIVDDEFIIRSSMKRVITAHIKSMNESINLTLVEACDGIECLIALYLANAMDEAPFISGSSRRK